jgi:cyclophilin family peptidyl-prolyl cis-trans isomerase
MPRLAHVACVLFLCVAGVLALVAHTRALADAHLEFAHLFDRAELGGSTARAASHAPAFCVADAATGAVGTPHAELWGDVVVAGAGGEGGNSAASAVACCASCAATRGCNVWVWCSDAAACGNQCWLKRVGDPATAAPHASGGGVPWTSGALPKDADVPLASLPPPDESIHVVALVTQHGAIRLRLQPGWSASSVAFVRLLAAHPLETPACEFYRVEPGFLLQGSLRALIPANNETTPGPRAMRRGDVGWAGGSFGPDFFIYLAPAPATDWGTSHTVWAEVADDASMAVAERIVALPPGPTKPGEMHIIAQRVAIDVQRVDGAAAVA